MQFLYTSARRVSTMCCIIFHDGALKIELLNSDYHGTSNPMNTSQLQSFIELKEHLLDTLALLNQQIKLMETKDDEFQSRLKNIGELLLQGDEKLLDDRLLEEIKRYLSKEPDYQEREIVLECLSVLIDITTTDYVHNMVEMGFVPLLIDYVDLVDTEYTALALWSLGNIATDYSTLIAKEWPEIQTDIRTYLILKDPDVISNAVFLLRNMTPNLTLQSYIVSNLIALFNTDDSELCVHILYILSYMGIDDDILERIALHPTFLRQLVDYSTDKNIDKDARIKALKILIDCSMDDNCTRVLLGNGIVKSLETLMIDNVDTDLLKEAIWLLSNISVCNDEQTEHPLDETALWILLATIEKSNYHPDIVEQSIHVFSTIDEQDYSIELRKRIRKLSDIVDGYTE